MDFGLNKSTLDHIRQYLRNTDKTAFEENAPESYGEIRRIARHRGLINHCLSLFSKSSPKGQLAALLNLAVADLIENHSNADKQPKIVHYWVEQARTLTSGREAKFANAILRKIAAELGGIIKSLEEKKRWNVLYSHPQALIDRWTHDFGEERTLALLQWNQQPPYIHVHDFKGILTGEKGEELQATLGLQGTEWPDYYRLGEGAAIGPLLQHPLYIQDPSTRLCAELLGDELSGEILDACAAPGGKSLHLLKRLEERTGQITAQDRESRLSLIRENIERLGLERISPVAHDWQNDAPVEWLDKFDTILLDAPCSNSGVIRKHPEVRWRLSDEDFTRLPQYQLAILKKVATCLKTGGKLVYSTCSFDPAENSGVIEAFLNQHKNFECTASITAFPPETGHDGIGAFLLQKH